ncbi:biotin--[acetyl-CoA-carboxylase] ligase [Mycolicibacterium mengxianglii]|uniref:biotin--[acetyl-CoA-carboxylase] ligase n=1 Tax=Mycolicibacterium mengxianglii TaxID=2736649 RepID=UPI0018EF150B|nr:biotin--[acetyl-CoA-carboxylase] ligase [Mycolicibacterium mengxianglii]
MSPELRTALDVAALRSNVAAPWQRIDVVAETGSTNADLLARAAAGADIAGTVLLTEFQSSGRGRHGRSWSAAPRSQIAMSVGVGTQGVPTDAWGWLPLLTGVAVVDALAVACPAVPAGLKWPNDVLVGTGKLAGILAEVAAPSPQIVVGLGLNVSLTSQEAPDPRATSLTQHGADVDRTELACGILNALGTRIGAWRAAGGADEALVRDYRARSLTLGTEVRATLPGDRAVVGTATDIDRFGRLLIDDGTTTVTVAAGDITHLRPADTA